VRDPTFDTGMLGSRKKKLAGLGMEKHEDGKRWKWSLDGQPPAIAFTGSVLFSRKGWFC